MTNLKYTLSRLGLILGLLIVTVTAGQAQPASPHKPLTPESSNYALMVGKLPHLQAGMMTAEQLTNNPNGDVDTFELVVIGKAVKQLTREAAMADLIEQAEAMEVRISACGLAMNKLGVAKEDLLPEIKMVRNGFTRMLKLKERNYTTLSP